MCQVEVEEVGVDEEQCVAATLPDRCRDRGPFPEVLAMTDQN